MQIIRLARPLVIINISGLNGRFFIENINLNNFLKIK